MLALPAGVWVDWLPRCRLLVWADLARGAALVTVPVDAASFLVSAWCLLAISAREARPARPALRRELAEGLRFVLGRPELRAITACTALTNLLWAAAGTVQLLFLVHQVGLAVLSLVPAYRLLTLVWFEGSVEAAPTLATVGPVTLAVVSAAAVGALVASRRPRHPVGWLLLGVGLAVAANVLVEPYVKYGLVGRPGVAPGGPVPGAVRLLEVVAETVQPTRASLWLRGPLR